MIYLNGAPLNATMFPDNTSQVWKLPDILLKQTNWFHITWEFSHEGEFMQIAQLKMLLEAYGYNATLRIKYLPYGRQDKKVSNDATFALRTFATLLNTLQFKEIIIHDPHSDVALDLIFNSRAVYPHKEIVQALYITESNMICYPDHGAIVKYSREYKILLPPLETIYGEKVRDQLTGNILNYEVIGDPEGKKVLIIDDICDGGATFKLLAKDLLAAGATEVNLFVTHGIFSRGLGTLLESGIKRIFTQDGEASEVQNQITYRRL